MPKPLRRIGASKLAAVSEYHSSQAIPLVLPETKRSPQSTHVIERPATGIVLTIASGSRAGEMIGTDDQEVMIGFNHDCLLRFPSDQHPRTKGKLLLRRGPEGWYVLRVSGDSAFVNQHLLEDKCPLRSGDMIRLSSRGPDVQFTMHSAGVAIRALVDRYLPPQSVISQESVSQAADCEHPTAALAADQPGDSLAVGPAGELAAMDVVASSPAAIRPDSLWSDWAWSQRSTKMAVALVAAILVLMAVLAWVN